MSISVETLALAKKNTKQAVEEAVTSVYRYKGSVETFEDLPTSGQKVGDVYNVEKEAGRNYAWDGSNWDALGIAENLGDIEFEGPGEAEVVVSFDGNNDRIARNEYDDFSKAIPLENLTSNEIIIEHGGHNSPYYLGYAFSNSANDISYYGGPGIQVQNTNNQSVYTIENYESYKKTYKYFFLPLTHEKRGPQGQSTGEKEEYFINPIIKYTALEQGMVTKTINQNFDDSNKVDEKVQAVSNQANAAYARANVVYDRANAAYNQANTAFKAANNAYNATNATVNMAVAAYDRANAAYNAANNAYNAANIANNSLNDLGNIEFAGFKEGVTNYSANLNGAYYVRTESTYGLKVTRGVRIEDIPVSEIEEDEEYGEFYEHKYMYLTYTNCSSNTFDNMEIGDRVSLPLISGNTETELMNYDYAEQDYIKIDTKKIKVDLGTWIESSGFTHISLALQDEEGNDLFTNLKKVNWSYEKYSGELEPSTVSLYNDYLSKDQTKIFMTDIRQAAFDAYEIASNQQSTIDTLSFNTNQRFDAVDIKFGQLGTIPFLDETKAISSNEKITAYNKNYFKGIDKAILNANNYKVIVDYATNPGVNSFQVDGGIACGNSATNVFNAGRFCNLTRINGTNSYICDVSPVKLLFENNDCDYCFVNAKYSSYEPTTIHYYQTSTIYDDYAKKSYVDDTNNVLSNDISNVNNQATCAEGLARSAENLAQNANSAANNALNNIVNITNDISNVSNVANDAYSLASNASNAAANASNLAQAAYDAANTLAPAAWQEIANVTTNAVTNSVTLPIDKAYDEYIIVFNEPIKMANSAPANSLTNSNGSLALYLGGQDIGGGALTLYEKMRAVYKITKISDNIYYSECESRGLYGGAGSSYRQDLFTTNDVSNTNLTLGMSLSSTAEIESGVTIKAYGKNQLVKEPDPDEGYVVIDLANYTMNLGGLYTKGINMDDVEQDDDEDGTRWAYLYYDCESVFDTLDIGDDSIYTNYCVGSSETETTSGDEGLTYIKIANNAVKTILPYGHGGGDPDYIYAFLCLMADTSETTPLFSDISKVTLKYKRATTTTETTEE